MKAHLEKGHVIESRPCSQRKGPSPRSPKFLKYPLIVPHCMTLSDQILHSDYTKGVIMRSVMPPALESRAPMHSGTSVHNV